MDVEVHALALLQVGNHVKEVPSLRVALRTQHPHQTFHVLPGQHAECLKANRGIDIITQNGFTGICVPGKEAVEGLSQESLAKRAVFLSSYFDGFLEIACQRHVQRSFCFRALYVVQRSCAVRMSRFCRFFVPPPSKMTKCSPSFPK